MASYFVKPTSPDFDSLKETLGRLFTELFYHIDGSNIDPITNLAISRLTVYQSTVLNESGGDNDTRMESDNDENMVFIDASADYFLIGGNTAATADISFSNDGAVVFNEQGNDVDFRVEGVAATSLLVCNSSDSAVNIGTTTEGDIANFASIAVVFNESGADRDFRFEGDTDVNLLYTDAGANHVIVGGISGNGKLSITGTANEKTVVIKAFAAQTASVLELVDSNDVVQHLFNSSGGTTLNAAANSRDTTINGDSVALMFFDASEGKIGIKRTINLAATVDLNGSFATAVRTETSNYTATVDDYSIRVDTGAGDITITLPTAVGITGRWYAIKKVTTDNNRMIIDADGSETIDGDTDFTTRQDYTAVLIQSNGANWDIY